MTSKSHSRSSVIENVTVRYNASFHSNYGPILYRFPHIARYWSKIAKFIYHTYDQPFNAPVVGDIIGISQRRVVLGKLQWWGYHALEKIWWHVKPFRHNSGPWQTDGRTEFLYQHRASAMLCCCAIKRHNVLPCGAFYPKPLVSGEREIIRSGKMSFVIEVVLFPYICWIASCI